MLQQVLIQKSHSLFMVTLHNLLYNGYFPRELPPPFQTREFASYISSNSSTLPASLRNNISTAKISCHNLARVGTLRRKLALPNPILHFRFCEVIEERWVEIQNHFNHSTLSLSSPILGPAGGRAVIPQCDQSVLPTRRAVTRAKSKYILKTDISQFYSSIYTHSIPWALHTKRIAKARRNDSNLLGNILDKCIRNSQDGQTMGIPIGSDTSLVIAELLLCELDNSLTRKLPNSGKFRYIDDYELGFTTYAEAEAGLAILQQILSEYELNLNPHKTTILDLPQPLELAWAVELSNQNISSTTPMSQERDLKRFFDKAFELAKSNPQEHVLKYAISVLRSTTVHQDNWLILQALLMQCINVETGTITIALLTLISYHQRNFQLDMDTISYVMNNQIIQHAPVNHGSEVAWALWGLITFRLEVNNESAKALSNMSDSIVALLALDADNRGLIPSGLNTNVWQAYMDTEELYGEHWLLSYEANIKNWLSSNGSVDHVSDDPSFKVLKQNNVSFYDLSLFSNMIPTGVAPSSGIAPMFSTV
jgi:hypothetical protein